MHEPDIAPLARRLAEENNVDWRRLPGSGEGGRVVERDVLGYLARVMAGEEAVDPTPEPVPEGMEAWPEDDVEAYAADRERADDADDSDSPPTLDDELFLFNDPAAVASEAVPTQFPADGRGVGGDDSEPATVVDADEREDDLWLVGDEPLPEATARTPGADAPAVIVPFETERAAGELEAYGPVDPETAALEPTEPDREVPASSEPPASLEAPDANGQDDVRLDELPDLTAAGVDDDPAMVDGEDGFAQRGRDAFELPELYADEAGARRPGDDATLDAEPLFEGEAGAAPAAGDDVPLEVVDDPREAGAPEVVATPSDEGVEPEAPEPDAGEPVLAEPEVAEPEVAEPEVAEPGLADTGAAVPEVAASDLLAGAVLARYGQVWRRRIDDRTLRRSVSDLASALDAPPSTVVALLLAKAARHGGAATGAVSVWRWRRGGAERVTVDFDVPLREAVHRLETARGTAEGDDAPSLVVADLSAVDLDEAVLHLEVPVLALGRSAGDGAWLSLSGERVDAATVGTLAQVAELLASPVRLLV